MKLVLRPAVTAAALAAVLVLLVGARPIIGADKDVSRIVKRVKKKLDGVTTFSCSFETVQVRKEPERKQILTGTILMNMKRPFKLRLERPGNLTVIDGETIWTYLPRHNQVQISDYVSDEAQFPSPHNIFRRFVDEREPLLTGKEEINGVLCDIITLVSRDPNDVKVTVWIDRDIDFPVKAIEETVNGDSVTHVLSDVRLNEKIDDDIFTFVPPKGAVKVDLRE